MKQLSKIEKVITHQICNKKNNYLESLLGDYMHDFKIKINKNDNDVTILVFKERIKIADENHLIDFLLPRLIFISTLLQLLDIFEKENFIISHPFSRNNSDYFIENEMYEKKPLSECCEYKITNLKIKKLIIYYSDCVIFKSESLAIYIKNKCMTEEEIRFKKTYNISIFALILSLVIGIGSLILPIIF